MCRHNFPPKEPLDLNLQEAALYQLRNSQNQGAGALGAAAVGNPVNGSSESSPAEYVMLRSEISAARRELDFYRLREEYLTLRVRIHKHKKTIDSLLKELDS